MVLGPLNGFDIDSFLDHVPERGELSQSSHVVNYLRESELGGEVGGVSEQREDAQGPGWGRWEDRVKRKKEEEEWRK